MEVVLMGVRTTSGGQTLWDFLVLRYSYDCTTTLIQLGLVLTTLSEDY